MSGTRQLFSNAPVTPQAPVLPVVPAGSNLAAAMMQPHPMALQTPSTGIPLGTLMALMQQGGQSDSGGGKGADPNAGGYNPYASMTPGDMAAQTASNLPFGDPNSPSAAYNTLSPGMPSPGSVGMQSPGGPGMPSPGSPGTASQGAPGMPSPLQPGRSGQIAAWIQSLLGGGGYPGPGAGYGGG